MGIVVLMSITVTVGLLVAGLSRMWYGHLLAAGLLVIWMLGARPEPLWLFLLPALPSGLLAWLFQARGRDPDTGLLRRPYWTGSLWAMIPVAFVGAVALAFLPLMIILSLQRK